MDNTDKLVEELLKQFVNGDEDVELVPYGWSSPFSFKKNLNIAATINRKCYPLAGAIIYYSYNKPVCAIINTSNRKYLLWWEFRESSTTYRGLYEFLNYHGIAKGKLNRRVIEDIKKSYKSFFVNQLKENKEKTND